ncbi:MAG: hypothetical protein PHE29_13450 [Tissierellia bacterium]|nr:hypothetical protein [Tissierellia bacterium]MDD4779223.1 hypothetical protein [Tissierellia bacterium]
MVKITMKTDNAAFSDDYEGEVARILREIADNIEEGNFILSARDINGNTVCKIEYEQDR